MTPVKKTEDIYSFQPSVIKSNVMRKEEFRKLLKEKIIILDGGMGSMLLKRDIPPGLAPELLNIDDPEVIKSIHEAYIGAGADVILTNTFGGNRLRLAESGLDARFDEINRSAVRIAKKAAAGRALVAFSIGPSGKFLEPVGNMSFDESYELFLEQARIAHEEESDIIIIETMSDLREIKAALIACKDAFFGPIIAQMTFAGDGRTVTGTDPLTAWTVLSAAGADAVGANCSVGPSALEPIVRAFCEAGDIPVSVEPNAGIPFIRGGGTLYPEKPEDFAVFAEKFAAMGVNLIGGCCGTTPEFISLIADKLKGKKPKERMPAALLRAASRTRTFTHEGKGCAIIGERINPSGRKELSMKLKEGNIGALREEALGQMRARAQLLEVNVGVPQTDEPKLQKEAVLLIESICDLPLVIDSSNPSALESALRTAAGKPVINSVNGEDESLKRVLPLARRYGACVIGLCLDENGIPETAEERVNIGKKIVDAADAEGIPREDLILDALTLPVSARPDSALETIKALKLIKSGLKVKTVLGVSNISFGLPRRTFVSAAFLADAIAAGLDFAIINPLEEMMTGTVFASNILSASPGSASKYIDFFTDRTEPPENKEEKKTCSPIDLIRNAVIDGDKAGIQEMVKAAMDDGLEPFLITQEGLIKGMEAVGERFEKGIFYLPQVILSAETMQTAFSLIKPFLENDPGGQKGTVVFAAVKGDIHDIGKNICVTLLENNGFKVIDLGKNVETESIIGSARQEKADIIALSALTTTTMTRMEGVIAMARKAGLTAKIIVGGAVLNSGFAESIGADGYGRNGVECVRLAEKFCRGTR
jgi:5-methyltetrahydrofolate--homocysteine methyltransferase